MSATLRVRVTPRAARSEIAGERGGVLLVRVTAPPEKGRDKVVQVDGLDEPALRRDLERICHTQA